MPRGRKHILLLRSGTGRDRYGDLLRSEGYRVSTRPVLKFAFVEQAGLATRLDRPQEYGGLIITSPRAVQALAQALDEERLRRWREKTVFAVGPATAAALREVGLMPWGEEAGGGAALAEVIVTRRPEKQLLFLAGNRRRDELPEALRAEGVPFEELCVYETRLLRGLDLTLDGVPDWIVFFSPSGVEAAASGGGIDPSTTRFAAIGDTTAAAARDAGCPPAAVAERPSPGALLDALRAADRRAGAH